MQFLKDIVSHINLHSLTSLELGLVAAGFAKLAIGMTLVASGSVGLGVAVAGYLLAMYDPGLVTKLEGDVSTELANLKAKVLALESKAMTEVKAEVSKI